MPKYKKLAKERRKLIKKAHQKKRDRLNKKARQKKRHILNKKLAKQRGKIPQIGQKGVKNG